MERLKSMKEAFIAQIQSQLGNLANVDAKELGEVVDMVKDMEEAIYYCTITKAMEAKAFFMNFYNADADRIAIENPIPTRIYELPPYSQTIQPYEYGHPYSKKTCLWLKNLPALYPTDIVTEGIVSWVSGGSKDSHGNPRKQSGTKIRDAKTRSKTFEGIAKAMAEQYGGALLL